MKWRKVPCNQGSDPRLLNAGPLATRLHDAALDHCGDHETDGVVVAGAIHSLVSWQTDADDFNGGPLPDNRELAKRLVLAGIWQEHEAGGWFLPTFLQNNPTAAEYHERQQARAEAGRRGGRRKAQNYAAKRRSGDGGDDGSSKALASARPLLEPKVKQTSSKRLASASANDAGQADSSKSLASAKPLLDVCYNQGSSKALARADAKNTESDADDGHDGVTFDNTEERKSCQLEDTEPHDDAVDEYTEEQSAFENDGENVLANAKQVLDGCQTFATTNVVANAYHVRIEEIEEPPTVVLPSARYLEQTTQPDQVAAASRHRPTESPVCILPLKGGGTHAVTDRDAAAWQDAYPQLDVVGELQAMRQWCLANPRHRKTKSGVSRFIVGWLRRSVDQPRQYGRRRSFAETADKAMEWARNGDDEEDGVRCANDQA